MEITADAILREIAKIAFFDLGEVIQPNSSGAFTLKPLSKIDKASFVALKVNSKCEYEFHIRIFEKLEALRMLGDYMNLWSGAGPEKKQTDDSDGSIFRAIEIINKRIQRSA